MPGRRAIISRTYGNTGFCNYRACAGRNYRHDHQLALRVGVQCFLPDSAQLLGTLENPGLHETMPWGYWTRSGKLRPLEHRLDRIVELLSVLDYLQIGLGRNIWAKRTRCVVQGRNPACFLCPV